MATIVFFSIPAQGHVHPTLGVVRELTARGHRVVYYSYEGFREKIRAAGGEFVGCESLDPTMGLTRQAGARVGSDLALSTRVLVDTLLALDEPVCREMERLRPDCIVGDSMAVWAKTAAQKLGIPYVCSMTTFAFNRESAKIMPHSLKDTLGMLLCMGKVTREIRRLQEAGYPVKSVLDLIGCDETVPTVVYTSQLFQPAAQSFPKNFAFVGPSLRPVETPVKKTGKTLIYISMGTVNNDMPALYRACIEAFQAMPYQVILSAGACAQVIKQGKLSENVFVQSAVDQIGVLEKTDIFLTHCGMNSASEGLYFGVPLLMLPQTSEQKGVARRVSQLGAGALLKGTSPGEIRRAAERLLRDPGYRKNAEKIGESFRASGGASAAADRIEAEIAGKRMQYR
ncbi:MAG: glucosyltransferase [Clostridiales bacterium]|nr:glucosyltransferase [Clostridiales bacterium]